MARTLIFIASRQSKGTEQLEEDWRDAIELNVHAIVGSDARAYQAKVPTTS